MLILDVSIRGIRIYDFSVLCLKRVIFSIEGVLSVLIIVL